MVGWLKERFLRTYERHLERQIQEAPTHVAVIQDGNRRYARKRGERTTKGHREGAKTTESLLEWCSSVGVEELTLYAFSTENFNRDPEERAAIFDLIAEKLHELATAEEIHDREVCIRALGEIDQLPERVQEAVAHAREQTREYDQFVLNVAMAYGGRKELLNATREIATAVANGEVSPEAIDVETVEDKLHDCPIRDVDLIIRTGGDERTSNFLPWHANGNEAAVYFCAPYWPEFSRIDFLRGIRTYEHRSVSWRQSRLQRALAMVSAFGHLELDDARQIIERIKGPSIEGVDSPPDNPEPRPDRS